MCVRAMGVTRRASRARSQSPAAGVSKSPAARARAGGVDKMNGYIDRDLGVQPFLVEEVTPPACPPFHLAGPPPATAAVRRQAPGGGARQT